MKTTDIDTLTFDQLPAAISLLIREVNSLKIALQLAPPEQADQLLTVDQAAAFLSLAKPTIYAMLSRGELPNLKRGKRVYFQKSDLLRYLKEGKRG
ncbi:MAG: mobilizable transposon Xis [Bacteroidetes bacterium]|nr:MAG: mobilizable transposon Xis [Bacteroidota bacterium]